MFGMFAVSSSPWAASGRSQGSSFGGSVRHSWAGRRYSVLLRGVLRAVGGLVLASPRATSWVPADGSRRLFASAAVLQRWRSHPAWLEARVRRCSWLQVRVKRHNTDRQFGTVAFALLDCQLDGQGSSFLGRPRKIFFDRLCDGEPVRMGVREAALQGLLKYKKGLGESPSPPPISAAVVVHESDDSTAHHSRRQGRSASGVGGYSHSR